jgi:hypothetical protein
LLSLCSTWLWLTMANLEKSTTERWPLSCPQNINLGPITVMHDMLNCCSIASVFVSIGFSGFERLKNKISPFKAPRASIDSLHNIPQRAFLPISYAAQVSSGLMI